MATNGERRRTSGSSGARSSHQQYRVHNGGRCFCNMRVVIRVSGTERNPGRLYYGCPKLRVNDRCGFFLWVDNETGFEDIHSMNEATSGMATASSDEEEWKRIVTKKLVNLQAEK
ncbi:Zinc finger, GRF-type [Sesbania bispinosa]|nr:Zinc finger, GRF-type [Sesbania bispinosa]